MWHFESLKIKYQTEVKKYPFININNSFEYIFQILTMDMIVTKQLPGQRVTMDQEIIDELRLLDQRRFHTNLSFFGGHPISLVKKDQNQIFQQTNKQTRQSPYLMCQKTDGVRYLLIITTQNHYFVSREGKNNLVSYRANCKVAKNWHRNPRGQFQYVIHVLDGQMINDHTRKGQQKLRYLIFDALIVFQRKIIDKTLKQRLELCQKFIRCNSYLLDLPNSNIQPGAIEVKVKDFFRLSCNTFVSTEVMRNMNLKSQPTALQFLQKYYNRVLPHQNDGIIFNNQLKPYILGPNNGYLKWKPSQFNTVDFLVVPNTNLQGKLSERVLDLYLGWRDSEISTIYRMMFYNFTVLQRQFEQKFEAAYNENPDFVPEDSFGIIAQCKYQKVEQGSQQAAIFKQLLSSTKKPEQIHEYIMKKQNQQKQLAVIKKIQGEPYTKFWQIFRIRNDKNMPNNHEVVFKIEQSIKDDIKYEDLIKKNAQMFDHMRINH